MELNRPQSVQERFDRSTSVETELIPGGGFHPLAIWNRVEVGSENFQRVEHRMDYQGEPGESDDRNSTRAVFATPCFDVLDALEGCSDISVLVLDRRGTILDYNRGATEVFGVGRSHCWRNRRIDDFCDPELASLALSWLRRIDDSQQTVHVMHVFHACQFSTVIAPWSDQSSGKVLVVSCAASPLVETPENVQSISSELVDIGPLDSLSRRELEVLLLLGQGLRLTEVSKHLHRSDRTIETHRWNIGEKLGFESRAEMVRFVTQNGLTPDLLQCESVSVLRP